MKVALYYPWIYLKGGVERSMLELIQRSEHEFVIYTSHYEPENTFEAFKNFDVRKLDEVSVNRSMGSVMKAALTIARQKIDDTEYDAFAVWCDGLGPLTLFKNNQLPSINICSTPLRPVYDPIYEREAKAKRGAFGRLAYNIFKSAFRFVDRIAWQKFDIVVSTSNEVTDRILRNKLCSRGNRLRIAYPGVDCQRSIPEITYQPYFLVVGRIMWTKNIELAVEAFIKADLPENWELVIAGFIDQKSEVYVEKLLQIANGDKRVRIVRNPEDEELNTYYANASAILFPPLNEDWGIVPLEAMLYSKAVVANASGGPLESIADKETGFLLKPDVKQWTSTIEELVKQPELVQKYGEAGRLRVERYDWGQFVAEIDKALNDAVMQSRSQQDPDLSKMAKVTS